MRGFWEKNRGVKKRMERVWGKCGGSAGLCSSCEGGYKAYRVVEDVARLEEAVGGGGGAGAGQGGMGGGAAWVWQGGGLLAGMGGDVPEPWERRDCVRGVANISE